VNFPVGETPPGTIVMTELSDIVVVVNELVNAFDVALTGRALDATKGSGDDRVETVVISGSDPQRLPFSVAVDVKKTEDSIADDVKLIVVEPSFVTLLNDVGVIETAVCEGS
jgi:hypothetical protein